MIMPCQVCTGGIISCSMGAAPGPISALPTPRVKSATAFANIEDSIPIAVIPSFGMCLSLANPTVAMATSLATAAALGVFTFTPMPCVPNVPSWIPVKPNVLVGGMPTVSDASMAVCAWGGMVTVSFAGQLTVMV